MLTYLQYLLLILIQQPKIRIPWGKMCRKIASEGTRLRDYSKKLDHGHLASLGYDKRHLLSI